MSEMDNRIVMLFSIITRGKARKFISLLAENGIGFHLHCRSFRLPNVLFVRPFHAARFIKLLTAAISDIAADFQLRTSDRFSNPLCRIQQFSADTLAAISGRYDQFLYLAHRRSMMHQPAGMYADEADYTLSLTGCRAMNPFILPIRIKCPVKLIPRKGYSFQFRHQRVYLLPVLRAQTRHFNQHCCTSYPQCFT